MSKERELLARVLTLEIWSVREELQAEIRELLVQPEQEPVAWQLSSKDSSYTELRKTEPEGADMYLYQIKPLYTSPQKREPLSDDEINECMETSDSFGFNGDVYIAEAVNAFENFARAIEKHTV